MFVMPIAVVAVFLADLVLTVILPKFYVRVAVPIRRVVVPAETAVDPAGLRERLAAAFPAYRFYSDGGSVWFRSRPGYSGWSRLSAFGRTRGLVTRHGGDWRCLHFLGLSEPLLLLLVASVMAFDPGFVFGWIVLALVAGFLAFTVVVKNREFGAVVEAIGGPAGGRGDGK
jgi:hypothetical protein